MSKVLINGEEVTPTKKVQLTKHMKRTDIQKLIKEKQKENEQSSSD